MGRGSAAMTTTRLAKTRMHGKPCLPSEPIFWLHQNILADTLPGHHVPDATILLLRLLEGLENAIYAWSTS